LERKGVGGPIVKTVGGILRLDKESMIHWTNKRWCSRRKDLEGLFKGQKKFSKVNEAVKWEKNKRPGWKKKKMDMVNLRKEGSPKRPRVSQLKAKAIKNTLIHILRGGKEIGSKTGKEEKK